MLASRTHWQRLVATIVVLMVAAVLAPRLIHPPGIQENRVLAPKPAWPDGLAGFHAFRIAADPYVADHFPARPYLIGALNRLRMLARVTGSNRVIVGRDGWLFFDDDTHMGAARNDPAISGPQIRSFLLTLAARTEILRARGATYLVVSPPVKETLYPQFAPHWFHHADPERLALSLPKLAEAAKAGDILYLRPTIADATRRGESTYSRHDTHWTGYGAYAGYVGLMTKLHAMGLTEGPRPISDFHQERLDRTSTPRDLALMLGVASFVRLDFPHIDNPAGEARIRTTYLGLRKDWTAPQVVDTGEVGKPVLLLNRDSFSNELLPLLFSHFSRIILVHNQDGFWRPEMIDRFKPDIAILEILESGLRFGVDGEQIPSAAAVARIDQVMGAAKAKAVATPSVAAKSVVPTLHPLDVKLRTALAGAAFTPNCNLELAKLTPGIGGEASIKVSGWISELTPRITSPLGWARLSGPGGDFATPIRVDGLRPDVATYFKVPAGAQSGFLGDYFMAKLPAGTYKPTVYRQTPGGWMACPGAEVLVAP